jgi:hypothetical protein
MSESLTVCTFNVGNIFCNIVDIKCEGLSSAGKLFNTNIAGVRNRDRPLGRGFEAFDITSFAKEN